MGIAGSMATPLVPRPHILKLCPLSSSLLHRQKCSLPKANKRFLNSIVASNMASNKRIKLNKSATARSSTTTRSIEQKSRKTKEWRTRL